MTGKTWYKKTWYKDWFNTQHYLDLYKHRDDTDAKKIIKLLNKTIRLPRESSVLDLACGNGRHSFLLAKNGFNVKGADLSPFLISQAKLKLKNEYLKQREHLSFEIKDMRKISYNNRFDLVVNLFSSFGYFENNIENYNVIKGISKSLKKGGYFFFDFLNSNYIMKNLIPYDIKKRNGNTIIQVRNIEDGFVVKNIIIIKNNRKGEYPLLYNFCEKIKLYSLADFRNIFKKYGFRIINIFGDYEGNSFNNNSSQRLIILAKKR